MTSDPFQLFIITLMMAGLPFIVWTSGRISELIANGEEERVPENLKFLIGKQYIGSVRRGETIQKKWKLGVAIVGLVMPLITLCSASVENFIPRLMVVLTSATVFFMGVALLEWLVRPLDK